MQYRIVKHGMVLHPCVVGDGPSAGVRPKKRRGREKSRRAPQCVGAHGAEKIHTSCSSREAMWRSGTEHETVSPGALHPVRSHRAGAASVSRLRRLPRQRASNFQVVRFRAVFCGPLEVRG